MCLSHFPDSSSQVGGLDPPLELVFVSSPFPQPLLSHPLCLLLIIVPLSPHCGLPHQPGADTLQGLLCPGLPFLCGEHGMESAGPGAAATLKSSSKRSWMKGRSVPSSVLRPGATAQPGPGQPGGRGECFPCVLISVRFLGVPGPGAGSSLSNNLEPLGPSRPCFIHELYKNCQS